jgi:hypothetical protein
MDFLQYTSGYDYIILNGMFGNSKGGAIYYIGLLLNEQSNRRAIIDCLIGNGCACVARNFGWECYSGREYPV